MPSLPPLPADPFSCLRSEGDEPGLERAWGHSPDTTKPPRLSQDGANGHTHQASQDGYGFGERLNGEKSHLMCHLPWPQRLIQIPSPVLCDPGHIPAPL